MHSIYTVSTQYLRNIYTVSTQYLHSIYTISTQYLHSIYTVSTKYLHRIYSIYTTQVPVEDPADDSEGVIGDIVDETDCEGRPCSCHAMDYR